MFDHELQDNIGVDKHNKVASFALGRPLMETFQSVHKNPTPAFMFSTGADRRAA